MNFVSIQILKINNGFLVIVPEQMPVPEYKLMAQEFKKELNSDDVLDNITKQVEDEMNPPIIIPVLKSHYQFSNWKECSAFLNYILDNPNN